MATVAALLMQKQELLQRLQDESSPDERDEIERRLEAINAALNLLDRTPRDTGDGEP